MVEITTQTFGPKLRSSINPAAAWFFLICCTIVVIASLVPRVLEILVLHYPVSRQTVSLFIDFGLFNVGFVLAAYRIWKESRQRGITPRVLPKRPIGVFLFAVFQTLFATTIFLGLIFAAQLRAYWDGGNSIEFPPTTAAPRVWWETASDTALVCAWAATAAFLGFYTWSGSKAARDAVLILSALQVLGLLTWSALWLAGVIPPPSDYAPFWDRPFSPKPEWLFYLWGVVNIWYFGFSPARKFYTDPA